MTVYVNKASNTRENEAVKAWFNSYAFSRYVPCFGWRRFTRS